jgi:cytochrome c peroxidase
MNFNYFSDEAQRGYELFLGDANGSAVLYDAECAHCHSFSRNFATFARNNYSNNGLDSAATLNDFTDRGLGGVTGVPTDNGRFREVSLRNIALTAPYMHDGRFKRLSDVLKHYTEKVQSGPTLSKQLLKPITLSSNEKVDLTAFLLTLTDKKFIFNPKFSYPKNIFLNTPQE